MHKNIKNKILKILLVILILIAAYFTLVFALKYIIIVLIIIGIILGLALYMLPSYIAYKRNHNNFVPILLVNLLVPFFGWLVAFIWAFTDNARH